MEDNFRKPFFRKKNMVTSYLKTKYTIARVQNEKNTLYNSYSASRWKRWDRMKQVAFHAYFYMYTETTEPNLWYVRGYMKVLKVESSLAE